MGLLLSGSSWMCVVQSDYFFPLAYLLPPVSAFPFIGYFLMSPLLFDDSKDSELEIGAFLFPLFATCFEDETTLGGWYLYAHIH